MTEKRLQTILAATKKGLQKLYGTRLKAVVLYGSYARGQATPESDIDVAIILDDHPDVWTEIERTGDLSVDLCLRYNVLVALLPVRQHDYERKQIPLFMNMRREGVTI